MHRASNSSILVLLLASALLAPTAALAQTSPADPVLFWYETQEGIWRVEAGGEPVQIVQPAESASVHGLDVARDTEHLYWLQLGPADMLEHIRRANLYGGEQHVVVDASYGMYYVHDTRVHGDWIYWSVHVSWATGTISFLRAARDGSGSSAVLPADPPWYIRSFAVDADDGHLYWLGRYSSGGPEAVRRSHLDGSEPVSLITSGSTLRSIALDRDRGHIYWSEEDLFREENRIMRADYDGENVVEVLASEGSVHQLDLDPLAGRIYWTDANRLVWRAALDGSGPEPSSARRGAVRHPPSAAEGDRERRSTHIHSGTELSQSHERHGGDSLLTGQTRRREARAVRPPRPPGRHARRRAARRYDPRGGARHESAYSRSLRVPPLDRC